MKGATWVQGICGVKLPRERVVQNGVLAQGAT